MAWVDKKIWCGSTELKERHFKCGWCGIMTIIHPDEGVPLGWVMTKEPNIIDYFCSRRCRYDFLTLECN